MNKGAINGMGNRGVISNTKKAAVCFALLRLICMRSSKMWQVTLPVEMATSILQFHQIGDWRFTITQPSCWRNVLLAATGNIHAEPNLGTSLAPWHISYYICVWLFPLCLWIFDFAAVKAPSRAAYQHSRKVESSHFRYWKHFRSSNIPRKT